MEIKYLINKSQFLGPCEAIIRKHRAELDAGGSVHVDLQKGGGYPGPIIVAIRSKDRGAFGADWERKDPSRFPARIKAAATALLNCGCEGRFEVQHREGSLTIRAI